MLASHWARCAGGLLVWALAVNLPPANADAPSAPLPEANDPGLTALLGLEHTPFRMDDPVGPDARCRNAGAGDLYERGRRIPGWEIGQYNCDDLAVFTLEREIGTQTNRSHLRIVDALAIPGSSYSGTGRKPHVNWAVSGDGVCGRGSGPQSSMIVALRWNSRDRVTARNGVLKAWRFNTQRGRIEPTSTRRIVCVNPAP
jgi:hypothetical protein